jgi:dTDP-4-amino-4,6-dideoxygalactose transaminase
MIPVNKPFLPPINEYQSLIQGIWERNWLTNNGPLVNELELRLKEYLGLEHLLFVNNGTIALQIALKALDLRDEVITTPFSYVATTSSIVWENCTPIFVDIDENTFNLDPRLIEQAITEKTTGIVATHVFGNPCDIAAITTIAEKHKLKVIYDAAHCFGTNYKGHSALTSGDISTISFHSTKLFHTVEGGAIATKDPELLKKIGFMRNFGHAGPARFNGVGINGKNSEFHAAMGLANLNYADAVLAKRKSDHAVYDSLLGQLQLKKPSINPDSSYNHAYYPIVFASEDECLKVMQALELESVYPRRYFFPPLSTLNYVKNTETPVAEHISRCILCLPLYMQLSKPEIYTVCRIILRAIKY